MKSQRSVSHWIEGAKEDDSAATQRLWNRYFKKLVRLARRKLDGAPCRAADEEDVALSAFACYCRKAAAGKFPDIADRDDLWRLLLKITAEKAIDQRRHERTQKRGGRLVRGDSALGRSSSSSDEQGFAAVLGDAPTPELAAIAAEEFRRLLDSLGDENLRTVALAKLEGCTNSEIEARLDCAPSTVERSLRLIRAKWKRELAR